ncbi:MAG TPA: hypothetical protein VEH84_09480 [Alphaproteobacteria bacterium]|nr:hypothetical protein [Alphaproteobacteria bacterium]
MNATLDFSPLLPPTVLAALAAVLGLMLVLLAWRRGRGLWWRLLSAALLLLALANPSLIEEERKPLTDIAVAVVDDSPSQRLEDRAARTEAALADLQRQAAAEPGLELRVVRAPRGDAVDVERTELFTALGEALAEVPQGRLAGVVMLTDGQVHDAPRQLGIDAPVHALLTGRRDEQDRRLRIVSAPGFGLVGETAEATIRIDDLPGDNGETVAVTVRGQEGAEQRLNLRTGQDHVIDLPVERSGESVFEIRVAERPGELSLANNRAAVSVRGVRDRLRVLLVSGEPHPGERVWRNLLKSDPAVDLVHFTILRPPEKQDGTPIRELSLIAFPIRELFELKLAEFDLIIFDRYRRRGVLPSLYLENIVEYVKNGGALLDASGPAGPSAFGLAQTPLMDVLPAEPTGEVRRGPFKPEVTETGRRHPVTRALAGGGEWGRWFRQVDADVLDGTVLMHGLDQRPLLVVNRVGEGRVAQLLSDQVWLWARGYDGGGPQGEMLRRLAHWLMKEPELEENDLRAQVAGRRVTIEQFTMDDLAGTVTVEAPDGGTTALELAKQGDGRATAEYLAPGPGLYRVTANDRTALAVVGALNPPEYADMRSIAEPLQPVAEATGGSVQWLVDRGTVELRRVRPGRDMAGNGWIGLRANGDYAVTGLREVPLWPLAAAGLIALLAMAAAWRREGR